MASKKQVIAPGVAVKTNDLYDQRISPVPRTGIVVRRHTPIGGCWVVQMDGIVPPQYVHENFLEVES